MDSIENALRALGRPPRLMLHFVDSGARGSPDVQPIRAGFAIRTATFGLIAYMMARLCGALTLLSAHHALQGDFGALAFLPFAFATFGLTWVSSREVVAGLQAVR